MKKKKIWAGAGAASHSWICFVNLRVWENTFFFVKSASCISFTEEIRWAGEGEVQPWLTLLTSVMSHTPWNLTRLASTRRRQETDSQKCDTGSRIFTTNGGGFASPTRLLPASSLSTPSSTMPQLAFFRLLQVDVCCLHTVGMKVRGRGQGDKKKLLYYKRRIYFQSDVPSWPSPLISTVALKTQFPASNKRLKITRVTVTLVQVRAASQVWLTIDVYLIRWKICSGACGCPFRADAHVTFFWEASQLRFLSAAERVHWESVNNGPEMGKKGGRKKKEQWTCDADVKCIR